MSDLRYPNPNPNPNHSNPNPNPNPYPTPKYRVHALQPPAEPAAAEGDDFGEWADTVDDAVAFSGVPPALAPYLRAWTQLLKVLRSLKKTKSRVGVRSGSGSRPGLVLMGISQS